MFKVGRSYSPISRKEEENSDQREKLGNSPMDCVSKSSVEWNQKEKEGKIFC